MFFVVVVYAYDGMFYQVFEYMFREPGIPNDGDLKPALSGRIEFHDVQFTYPSRPNNQVLKVGLVQILVLARFFCEDLELLLLQGLNLVIEAGRTTALVGPSGGGKSSIVSLIQHFYEPTSGVITIDNVDIKNILHSFYHQKVSRLFIIVSI